MDTAQRAKKEARKYFHNFIHNLDSYAEHFGNDFKEEFRPKKYSHEWQRVALRADQLYFAKMEGQAFIDACRNILRITASGKIPSNSGEIPPDKDLHKKFHKALAVLSSTLSGVLYIRYDKRDTSGNFYALDSNDPFQRAALSLRQYLNITHKHAPRLHAICARKECQRLFVLGKGGGRYCSSNCQSEDAKPERDIYNANYQQWTNDSEGYDRWAKSKGLRPSHDTFPGRPNWTEYVKHRGPRKQRKPKHQ